MLVCRPWGVEQHWAHPRKWVRSRWSWNANLTKFKYKRFATNLEQRTNFLYPIQFILDDQGTGWIKEPLTTKGSIKKKELYLHHAIPYHTLPHHMSVEGNGGTTTIVTAAVSVTSMGNISSNRQSTDKRANGELLLGHLLFGHFSDALDWMMSWVLSIKACLW